MKTVMQEFVS